MNREIVYGLLEDLLYWRITNVWIFLGDWFLNSGFYSADIITTYDRVGRILPHFPSGSFNLKEGLIDCDDLHSRSDREKLFLMLDDELYVVCDICHESVPEYLKRCDHEFYKKYRALF